MQETRKIANVYTEKMLPANLPRENVENRKSKIENGYVLLEDNEGSSELAVV